eukprot:11323822-Heterocapsa_arctica.AAC.1
MAMYKRIQAPTTYKVSLCIRELRQRALDMRKQMAKDGDRSCPHCDDIFLRHGLARRPEASYLPCLARILLRWRSIAQLQ